MGLRTLRNGALVLLVVAVATTSLTGIAVAHGGDDGFHHHDGWMGTHGNWGWIGMGGMPVWGLVLIAIPALVLYAIATRIGGSGDAPSDDALSMLRERYARGEIDDEEFETRRQQLQRTEQSS
jgi:putative membrane protein